MNCSPCGVNVVFICACYALNTYVRARPTDEFISGLVTCRGHFPVTSAKAPGLSNVGISK